MARKFRNPTHYFSLRHHVEPFPEAYISQTTSRSFSISCFQKLRCVQLACLMSLWQFRAWTSSFPLANPWLNFTPSIKQNVFWTNRGLFRSTGGLMNCSSSMWVVGCFPFVCLLGLWSSRSVNCVVSCRLRTSCVVPWSNFNALERILSNFSQESALCPWQVSSTVWV